MLCGIRAALVLASLAARAAAKLEGGGASSAVVYAIEPAQGSLAGGTYLTILGAGLAGLSGAAAATTVFVGGAECVQNQASRYDSSDSRLVCWTPPSPTGAEGAFDVQVAVVSLDGSAAYVACPLGAATCRFAYRFYAATPQVSFASLGGAAGSVFQAGGYLISPALADYAVRVGGGAGGAGGATTTKSRVDSPRRKLAPSAQSTYLPGGTRARLRNVPLADAWSHR